MIEQNKTKPTPNKLAIEENLLNPIQGTCEKPMVNIILNGERLNAFSLRLGTAQEYLCPPLLSGSTIRPKKIKGERHLN